ncbi:glycosyl transferase family protein [Candidatus Magnetobacterium bavaricum]|uniref:Glycosyl transferase family protein n=1 Tax=Candidatus Magnetobacterium bavaricum TaxID=29290 RepID=A0A0F3GKS8_9BACT|nr:glycosyl transferase family protein [Candidatus Magnetobacterium bavaricum]
MQDNKAPDKLPVSVVIVTKNEELNIAGALQSACMAQEIVIVDDYSTDRTIDICRAYNARIYQNHWQGFAPQKQFAIDHAQGPWVFLLDSDERLTPELVQELHQVIAEAGAHFEPGAALSRGSLTPRPSCSGKEAAYDGFYVPRKNFFLGKWIRHSGWWPDNTLRLFKKDRAHMHQRQVHEKVLLDGRAGNLRNPIEHYSYRDISDFIKRMDRYTTLAAEELARTTVKSYTFAFKISLRLIWDFLAKSTAPSDLWTAYRTPLYMMML